MQAKQILTTVASVIAMSQLGNVSQAQADIFNGCYVNRS